MIGRKKSSTQRNVFSSSRRSENNIKTARTISKSHDPCISTPMRRETYEVAKPMCKELCIPSIKAPSPRLYPPSLDKDLDSNFICSKIVSSSPQLAGNEGIKTSREPLKEFNYNTRHNLIINSGPDEKKKISTPPLNFDRDSLSSPTALNQFNSLLFDDLSFSLSKSTVETNGLPVGDRLSPNIDRDSLHSPLVWNVSNSPTFDHLSFSPRKQSDHFTHKDSLDALPIKQFSSFDAKLHPLSIKEKTPFYLNQQDSLTNLTFTHDDNLMDMKTSSDVTQSRAFFNVLEFTPARNVKSSIHTAHDSGRQTSNSLNEKFYYAIKPETSYFDATYNVNGTPYKQELNEPQPTRYASINDMCVDISPPKPLFRADNRNLPKFKRERRKSDGGTKYQGKTDVESPSGMYTCVCCECNTLCVYVYFMYFFILVFGQEKKAISLFDEPDYLLHPYGVTTIPDPFSR